MKFDFEVIGDVTGQVKFEMFDYSGLMRLASKIFDLNANNANKSACIVSLTF